MGQPAVGSEPIVPGRGVGPELGSRRNLGSRQVRARPWRGGSGRCPRRLCWWHWGPPGVSVWPGLQPGGRAARGQGPRRSGSRALRNLPRPLRTLTCLSPRPRQWTPPGASRTSTGKSACCLRAPSGPLHTGRWGSCGRRGTGPPSAIRKAGAACAQRPGGRSGAPRGAAFSCPHLCPEDTNKLVIVFCLLKFHSDCVQAVPSGSLISSWTSSDTSKDEMKMAVGSPGPGMHQPCLGSERRPNVPTSQGLTGLRPSGGARLLGARPVLALLFPLLRSEMQVCSRSIL